MSHPLPNRDSVSASEEIDSSIHFHDGLQEGQTWVGNALALLDTKGRIEDLNHEMVCFLGGSKAETLLHLDFAEKIGQANPDWKGAVSQLFQNSDSFQECNLPTHEQTPSSGSYRQPVLRSPRSEAQPAK